MILVPLLLTGFVSYWLYERRAPAEATETAIYGQAPYGGGDVATSSMNAPMASTGQEDPFARLNALAFGRGAAALPTASSIALGPDPEPTEHYQAVLADETGDGRAWIRPEPRSAPDEERFGFRVPAGYAVLAMSGEASPGWAHVIVRHPDHGEVEGYAQSSSLLAASSAASAPGLPVTGRPKMGARATAKVKKKAIQLPAKRRMV